MKKIIRVGKIEEQDAQRQQDYAQMSPKQRVDAVIQMQHDFLRWDLNPRIKRIGKIKRLNYKDVT